MASNLYRLLSLPIARSELSNSASRRLIVTTTQLFQNQKPEAKEPLISGDKDEIHSKIEDERNSDSKDEEISGGEEGVNKQTGEIGGPRGPEPTRYGDWEQKGRCSDFWVG